MNKKIDKKLRELNVRKLSKEQRQKLNLLTLSKIQFVTI